MKKLLFALIVLGLCGYVAWTYSSNSHGEQIVNYVPAMKECFSEPGYKFCIFRAKQGTNGQVAYLLHGRNLDENSWNDDTFYTSMLQKYWAERQIKPPVIISVSFGGFWILTPPGKSKQSGLLDTFLKVVIPHIENKIEKPLSRAVFGESMGGINSLIAGLAKPEQFEKVAALCPPIYKDVTPYSNLEQMKVVMERTGAEPKTIYGVLTLVKHFVADENEWKQIAPILMLQSLPTKVSTRFYVSAGLYDNYGNYEGVEEFAAQSRQRGLDIEWRPIYGGHCAIDVISLGEFLAPAHESPH